MSTDEQLLEILERLFDAKLAPIAQVVTDHEARIRKSETSITQIKTVWTMLSLGAGFLIHSLTDFLLGKGPSVTK